MSANRDAVTNDLVNLAARAQQFYRRPAALGGGAQSFALLTDDPGSSFQARCSLARDRIAVRHSRCLRSNPCRQEESRSSSKERDPSRSIFLHGWADTHRLWDRQVEALRERYRCVRFTLPGFEPGHARTAYSLDHVVEVIRQVIEAACGGKPVTLLLHDWGCVFGYQFAVRYPQLVRRVVGVDVGDTARAATLPTSG